MDQAQSVIDGMLECDYPNWNTPYPPSGWKKCPIDVMLYKCDSDNPCRYCGYGETNIVLTRVQLHSLENAPVPTGYILIINWCGCMTYSVDYALHYYTDEDHAVKQYRNHVREEGG